MFNATRPHRSDLPTNAELFKSTGIAAAVAGALLIAVVLPAEYGIDPTRLGAVTGLTEMGQLKRQLALEAEADAAQDARVAAAEPTSSKSPATPAPSPAPSSGQESSDRRDVTTFTLAPNQGVEIKLAMKSGAQARFDWASSGGKINFDTHGDRPGVKYHAYGKGSSEREQGTLIAAFDGSHGWFWRNRTGAPVTITLKTEGAYAEIKRVV